MRIVSFTSTDRITVYPFEGAGMFRNTRRVGDQVIGEYYGSATEGQLATYVGVWPIGSVPAIPVVVTGVTGAVSVSGDFTEAVVKELIEFTVTASVALPGDDSFLMPMRREDTGRTIYVDVNIIAGEMAAVIKLPTSGRWICGEVEINSAIEGQPFTFDFAGIVVTAIQ